MKRDIYTGSLTYKNVDFTFVFDGVTLRLITPKERYKDISLWFRKKISNGIYTYRELIYVDEILCGIVNETGHKIVFIPSKGYLGKNNLTLLIGIDYYIINKYDRNKIDRISIQGPEINHIFPTTIALDIFNLNDDGSVGVKTRPFKDITTKKETFNINGKSIQVYFGISNSSSYQIGKAPISIFSNLYFEFESTDDYEFIIKLLKVAKKFIQYLCYRKNITFSTISLFSSCSDGLHEKFANLYEVSNNMIEPYPIERGKVIKYQYLIGSIGRIFNDIVTKQIYIEHIPETYELGTHIDAGRFVMITAAFEWEFKRNYPNGIEKNSKTLNAEKKVTNIIDELIKNNSGKEKEIFKFLKKLLFVDNLKSKIIMYGKDYGYLSDIFGENLYYLNDEVLNYRQMGERLSKQRNNFAHGNIDKDFIGLSVLDLEYLELMIYIIQLNFYGISQTNIKYAINDLFYCNLEI